MAGTGRSLPPMPLSVHDRKIPPLLLGYVGARRPRGAGGSRTRGAEHPAGRSRKDHGAMPLRESKIAPAFFIGLGGCGGAIVDELARKVKQEESFERYQDLIHFF